MSIPAGLIEALTDAIGGSDTQLGGMYMTRLETAGALGDTSINVGTTLNWPDVGAVAIEGQVYAYTSKDDTNFYGITYVDEGVTLTGLARKHALQATVLDLSRTRSAVDQLRRAMLVETAEGADLDTIGRNLGVNRPISMRDDELFRAVIQAVAYNPRGTIYGLELALDALVGPGNYEIFEDLANSKCEVFIILKNSALAETISAGKTYLQGATSLPAQDPAQLNLPSGGTPLAVGYVRLKDENRTVDCSSALPSVDTEVEFDGGSPRPTFAFQGTSESGSVFVTAQSCQFHGSNLAHYNRIMRIRPESAVEVSVFMTVPIGAGTLTNDGNQFALELCDGVKHVRVGIRSGTVAISEYKVVFIDDSGNPIAGATQFTRLRGALTDVGIRLRDGIAYLLINGVESDSMAMSAGVADSSGPHFSFGILDTGSGLRIARVKSVRIYAHTPTDFWSIRGGDGTVLTSVPTRLRVLSGPFVAGDVGKPFLIKGSTAVNAQGGNNNGRWFVDTVSGATDVTLKGLQQHNLRLEGATPLRIFVPDNHPFQYPDDLGKKIVITGSELGNNGTYTISKLLDPVTLVDFGSLASKIPEKTTVAEVSVAAFVTEEKLDWQLLPVFTTETGLTWVLSDAGSIVVGLGPGGFGLTFRQDLPLTTILEAPVFDVGFTTVLSAQLLEDITFHNSVTNADPLRYLYYPFYLADALANTRELIDDLLAAGVFPELSLV